MAEGRGKGKGRREVVNGMKGEGRMGGTGWQGRKGGERRGEGQWMDGWIERKRE